MKTQKLPSGSYRVVVANGYDERGKRVYKSFTAETEWEALRLAEDFKRNRDEVMSKNITVGRAMETYIESRLNVVELTTVRGYRQIRKHCFKCIMETKLTSLRVIDIQRAVNLESARVGAKYVKNAFGLLKSVLKMYDVRLNIDSIKLPKYVRKEKELPAFETVFGIVKGTEIELAVLLASWMSLRMGEVTGLQFQDVDYNTRKLKVRRTIIQTDDGYEVRDGCKTEKSKREIRLPEYIINMIKNIPHENETDFIVTLTRKAIYSRFKRLMKKHDYDITFHDLRHLNASVMLMLGIPDKYAMERGGWATDYILKNVYQQTFSSERDRVDDTIDSYFSGIISEYDAQSAV